MTDHPDPVVSSGGFCGPSDELYKFFKPREIPGTLDELAATWDTNVTTTREQATAYLMRGRYARGNRADHEATAWQEVATTLRSVPVVTELADVWAGFAQAQADLVAALPRKTPERRRARANSYVYDLAAIELRICLDGGGPMPSPQSALPVVTAPRGAIRFITPPAAPKRPCDCGATDVHDLGTGPYCSALSEYDAGPGPGWKAQLLEQVEALRSPVMHSDTLLAVSALIEALPDPVEP